MAYEAGADALGLVGPMPSGPGTLTVQQIAEIWAEIKDLPIDSFFLISETEPTGILAQYRQAPTTTIQLVDTVLPEYYPILRNEIPDTRLVQVVHVEDETALEFATAYQDFADALLLDSGNTKGAVKQLGGTGNTHNWQISKRLIQKSRIPVWLAGGLKVGNVADAIQQVNPHGVDVCSGLRPDGDLNPAALQTFIKKVKHAP